MTASPQSPERIFRAICTNGVFRIRTRATVGLQAETDTGLRSLPRRVSAAFQSAAMPLPGKRLTARTFERSGPNAAAARVLAGLILNLRGGFKALRSLSFRALFQSPEKPLSVAFIFCRPSPFVAAAHVEQHAAKEIPNVGKAYRRIGNV